MEGGRQGGSVDIHSLRMAYTTLTIGNGADPKSVQEILGYATLAMTMNAYKRATDQSKRRATAALPIATISDPDRVLLM